MNSIKMIGLSALVVVMVALVNATPTMAESIALCSADQSQCATNNQVTHIHESTLFGAKARLLTSVLNVECDVLFLGDTFRWFVEGGGGRVGERIGLESFALPIVGDFTYTNCGNNCTVEEVSGSTVIEVGKSGHETASVIGEGEVNVHCGILINCTYNGEGLEGTGKGPLLSSETNGSVSLKEQETSRVSGFCPEHAFLDITTTPLSATYITS